MKKTDTFMKDPQKDGKLPVFSGVMGRFPRALKLVADISEWGAARRDLPPGDMSFLDMDPNDLRDALGRHLLDEAIEGIYNGFLHAGQQAWNTLARLEIMLEGGVPGRYPVDEVEDDTEEYIV